MMAHALRIFGVGAIYLLRIAAILAFLLAGILCAGAIELKISRSLASEQAAALVDWISELERLIFLIRSYAWDLLTRDPGKFLPWFASVAGAACGVVAFAALWFGPAIRIANFNIGLAFIFGASFLGICGDVLWQGFSARASSLDGLVRNAIRLASCETAAALAMISGVILAGSISMQGIVDAQMDQGAWFCFLAPLGFLLFAASSLAADAATEPLVPDGKELPDGIRAGGPEAFRWPLGSPGATIHLLTAAGLATTVFLGGWLRPFAAYQDHFAGTPVELLDALPPLTMAAIAAYLFRRSFTEGNGRRRKLMKIASGVCAGLFAILTGALFAPPEALLAIHGAFWFLAKMAAYLYGFLWLRARIPRLRFGKPIRAAWNFLIPLTAVNLFAVGSALAIRERWGWSPAASTFVATGIVLAVAIILAFHDVRETAVYGVEP